MGVVLYGVCPHLITIQNIFIMNSLDKYELFHAL